MANDYIFLKCRHCGKTSMVAKYYPSTGVYIPDIAKETIPDWIEEHSDCSLKEGYPNLEGDRRFDLFTESDDRFNELYNP